MDSTLFDGKYRVCEKLGEGAFGEVYLVLHVGLNVHRAIKRILKSQDRLRSGQNEVMVLKNLFHPGLPIIYDIWEDDDYFYIVEEYVRGITLADYVAVKKKLSEKQVISFAISICAILQYMQENGGICHLDIKPENIIVSDDKIKLVDFGSGFIKGKTVGPISSTAGYAAPELYLGKEVDARSDIYSVGMLMVFMLTGDVGKAPKDYCSEFLYSVIKKCICPTMSGRFASPQALKCNLTGLSEKMPTDKSVLIKVYGSMPRVGTTHLSVMLASFFKKRGYEPFLLLDTVTPMLSESTFGVSFKNGIYTVDGLNIIPEYEGFVDVEDTYKGKKLLIKDCGLVRDLDMETEAGRETICLLVCGHTLEEMSRYHAAAEQLCDKQKEFITCINFAGGREFVRLRQLHVKGPAVRIPYCTAPYMFDDIEAFEEIFYEVQKRQGGHRRFRLRRFIGRHTFVHRDRKLSGKCGGKENSDC